MVSQMQQPSNPPPSHFIYNADGICKRKCKKTSVIHCECVSSHRNRDDHCGTSGSWQCEQRPGPKHVGVDSYDCIGFRHTRSVDPERIHHGKKAVRFAQFGDQVVTSENEAYFK